MTDASARPDPELVTAEGLRGGPVYSYRGAEIRCLKGGHVCALLIDDHPLNGWTFGVVATVAPLVASGRVSAGARPHARRAEGRV